MTAEARNIFSGNSINVKIFGNSARDNMVQGNFIGTDVNGSFAIGTGNGVSILDAPANTIGGTVAGAGNLISGNSGDGVHLTSSSATTGIGHPDTGQMHRYLSYAPRALGE